MILLGLSGVSRAGKDWFCSFANKYFTEIGLVSRRFALADEVKLQLEEFISINFNCSAFTTDEKLKEIIRPIFISFAEAKKRYHNDDYWINQLKEPLKDYKFIDVAIVTDIRFPVELSWIKENGGTVIHISRYEEINGIKYTRESPHQLEQKYDPLLKANADIKFSWPELSEIDAEIEVGRFLTESRDIWEKPCLL